MPKKRSWHKELVNFQILEAHTPPQEDSFLFVPRPFSGSSLVGHESLDPHMEVAWEADPKVGSRTAAPHLNPLPTKLQAASI